MAMGVAATIDDLPDGCLALIFQSLSSADRNICSLVCRRWLTIDGQNRRSIRLTFRDFSPFDPNFLSSILFRFDFLTELALSGHLSHNGNEILTVVSQSCPNLTSLSINFFKFSCNMCGIGYKGHCGGVKNLTSLKLVSCSGDLDKVVHLLVDRNPSLVEVHLEKLKVTDVGLKPISKCSSLEVLHLLRNVECSDAGIVAVAEGCKLLREVHIDGGEAYRRIGDKSLRGVAECCPNLEELLLVGMYVTKASLEVLVSKCPNLERLALCGTSRIRGCYIADKVIGCVSTMSMLTSFGVLYWIKGNVNPKLGSMFWRKWRDGNYFY